MARRNLTQQLLEFQVTRRVAADAKFLTIFYYMQGKVLILFSDDPTKLYRLDLEFRKESLTPVRNDKSKKENRPPPGVASKRKQKANDASTSMKKKKRPEVATKQKKKREEASVIVRHPTPTLQVSTLSKLLRVSLLDERFVISRYKAHPVF